MKKLFMILPLVLVFCFAFGCQKAEEVVEESVVDIEADITAIKGMLDQFDALLNAGEPEKLVSLNYAENAVRMPADESMLRGKEAILEDVQVDGDLAFMRGVNTGSLIPKDGGEPIPAIGKWMAVYKRQADGSWKVIADIYNRDNPLPTSSEKE